VVDIVVRWVGGEGSFKGKEVCSKDVFVLIERGIRMERMVKKLAV
jgi:hypothetical protein